MGRGMIGKGMTDMSLVLFPCQTFPCPFFSLVSGRYQILHFVAVRVKLDASARSKNRGGIDNSIFGFYLAEV